MSINQGNYLDHIAFIMDGNRRWAKAHGFSLQEGYRHGAEKINQVLSWVKTQHIPYVSFFAFGKDNWKRPQIEIDLIWKTLVAQAPEIQKNLQQKNIRFVAIGDREHWPAEARLCLENLETNTLEFDATHAGLVIDYSGTWDIEQACLRYAQEQLKTTDNLPQSWQYYLKSAVFPEPQIIVRTGGEQRLSNFYLYNIAYTELFFIQQYWPDFTQQQFDDIVALYHKKQRRFGQ
jgi:undecaprenyl diphosphate synthase